MYFSKCSALGILLFVDPSVESLVLTTCAFVKLNPSNSSNLFVMINVDPQAKQQSSLKQSMGSKPQNQVSSANRSTVIVLPGLQAWWTTFIASHFNCEGCHSYHTACWQHFLATLAHLVFITVLLNLLSFAQNCLRIAIVTQWRSSTMHWTCTSASPQKKKRRSIRYLSTGSKNTTLWKL